MTSSPTFLKSCQLGSKRGFAGPELTFPTSFLGVTALRLPAGHRDRTLVRPFPLKASMWAVWGNSDFSILEKPVSASGFHRVSHGAQRSRTRGKTASGWNSADGAPRKHLAESA